MEMEYERDKYVYPGRRIEKNGMPNGCGQGLGVRDFFAAQALTGILSGYWSNSEMGGLGPKDLAEEAYAHADAMLAARGKTSDDERLRAAAPELLAALIEVEEYFDDRADAEYTTESAIPMTNIEMDHLTTVRAAIAKAEGKGND